MTINDGDTVLDITIEPSGALRLCCGAIEFSGFVDAKTARDLIVGLAGGKRVEVSARMFFKPLTANAKLFKPHGGLIVLDVDTLAMPTVGPDGVRIERRGR